MLLVRRPKPAAVALAITLSWTALACAQPTPTATADPYPAPDYDRLIERIETEELAPAEIHKLIEVGEAIKEHAKEKLTLQQRISRALLDPWVFFGFAAQFMFGMRFVVQLIASERKKRSYVPVSFWYLSLAGGMMLFVYAIRLRDPVFVFGQGLGVVIYVRNLLLIYGRQGKLNERIAERTARADQPAEFDTNDTTP